MQVSAFSGGAGVDGRLISADDAGLAEQALLVRMGTIVEATIISASGSTKSQALQAFKAGTINGAGILTIG